MENKFSIAVVTPIYNAGGTIIKSLTSLINQSFKNWISIIINDGSTDNTKDILQSFENDPRFIIIHLAENRGRGYARKVGLRIVKEVSAKYMCMLDGDDVYYHDKLASQYNYMEKHPDITLMSTSIGIVNKESCLKRVIEPFSEETILKFHNYEDYIQIPHACSIVRVSDIGEHTFNSALLLTQDQDFLRRFLMGKKYSFVPGISYLYYREDSFSVNKYAKSSRYAIKAIDGLPISQKKKVIYRLKSWTKVLTLRILSVFRMENRYLDKIGRLATSVETLQVEVELNRITKKTE